MTARAPSRWFRHLTHPAPLAACAVLALNDHVLKGGGYLPGWITGKLSDFAGLFLVPVLVVTLTRLATCRAPDRWMSDRSWIAFAVLSTMVLFSGLQLHPATHAVIEGILGPNVMDPTDLIALPMSVIAGHFLLKEPRWELHFSQGVRAAALVLCVMTTVATSPKHPPVPPPSANQPCAVLRPDRCVLHPDRIELSASAQRLAGFDRCSAELVGRTLQLEGGATVHLGGSGAVEVGPDRVVLKQFGSLPDGWAGGLPADPELIGEMVGAEPQHAVGRASVSITGFSCRHVDASPPVLQVAE